MEVLIQSIRRTCHRFIFAAICLFLVGGLIVFAITTNTDPETFKDWGNNLWILWLIGGLFLLGGILLVGKAIQLLDPDKAEIMRIVKHDPNKIVWVYNYVTIARPIPVRNNSIWVRLDDKKQVIVSVSSKNVQPLLKFFADVSPKAHIGYDRETEKQYLRDPRSVLVG